MPRSLTTLSPTGSSASAARRIVAAALAGTEMRGRLDEALLLVTEVVTNAIVHAGTDIDLHMEISPDSIRVEVVDRTPGLLLVAPAQPDETREGGRGLLLLDALANEWGTRHFHGGKAVWFLLTSTPQRQLEPPPAPELRDVAIDNATESGVSKLPPATEISWLLDLPADVERKLSPSQFIGELLYRLADGLDVRQCWVYAHSEDDDRRWELLATNDRTALAPDPDSVRQAAQSNSAQLPADGITLVPLHGLSGVIGALAVRHHNELSVDHLALARLVGERIGIVVRDDRARVAELRSRGSLALLAEASEMFAGTLDVQLAMTLATQLVVPRFARWSAVWDTSGRLPRLMAVAHADETRLSLLQKALSSPDGDSTALRLASHVSEHRPSLLPGTELPTEVADERAGEILTLPLVSRRRLLGVLIVGRPPGRIFAADDVGLLNDLARRTAVAVDSARLYEESTAIARALQASLLPPTLPQSKISEFGARYAAAGEGNEVGGDFYDVFELFDTGSSDTGWGIAIGDVCGKGPEAAAITGMVRDVLRLLVRDGHPPPAALRRLNEALLQLGDRGRFCTATLGTVTQDGDCLQIRLSSAGHPPPVLVRHDGIVELVGRSGTLLGVIGEVDLAEDLVLLRPGDALVFYTDGVTERRHGNMLFGEGGLLECLRSRQHRSADAIAGLVEERVQRFGVARDDLAVLVVRCAEQPRNDAPSAHRIAAAV